MPRPGNTSRLISLALLIVPVVAITGEARIAASVGVGVTDNIDRVPSEVRSEVVESADLMFSLEQESRKLEASLGGELAYMHYGSDSFDDDLIGRVVGAARLELLEKRLVWGAEDSFGQARRSLFLAPTPENLEHVNYFATGPEFSFPIGSSLSLDGYARYERVDYEFSPYGNQRYAGALGIARQLSAAQKVSLNLVHGRIEPDAEAASAPYDRQVALVHYEMQGTRSELTAEAGATRVARAGESQSGALFRLDISRKVGRFSSVSVDLRREHTDSGNQLHFSGGSLPVFGLDGSSPNPTADPYKSTSATLGWEIVGRRTSIGVAFAWTKDDEPISGNGDARLRTGVEASAARRFARGFIGRASASYAKDDVGEVIREYIGNLGLTWAPSRRLYFDLSGEYYRFKLDFMPEGVIDRRVWLRIGLGDATLLGSAF